jgi:hypothetical protein
VLVTLAVVYRGRPDAHKRLMLLASISFMGPAVARISRWPLLGGEQGPFTPAVLLGLLAAVVVYDLITLRRVHPATLFGVGLRWRRCSVCNSSPAPSPGRRSSGHLRESAARPGLE